MSSFFFESIEENSFVSLVPSINVKLSNQNPMMQDYTYDKPSDINNNEKFIYFENEDISNIIQDIQPSLNISNIKSININENDELNNSNKNNKEIEEEIDNIIIFSNNNINNKDLDLKKKKNRPRNVNKRPKHDKFSKDNIKTKIQVHYIKFLIDLLNIIIKEILREDIKFYPLKYKFVKEINNKSFNYIKMKSLGEIFKFNVSPKYKKYELLNIEVYDEVTQKSQILKNILDKPYLEFIKIFYFNKKKLNLLEYGLNKDIILPNNIHFYEDLVKKNKSGSSIEDKLYHNKIKKIIFTDFIGSPFFECK